MEFFGNIKVDDFTTPMRDESAERRITTKRWNERNERANEG